MSSSFEWIEFSGNLLECRPAYQGGLMNTPRESILSGYNLLPGSYDVWFGVDYPMDGVLNINTPHIEM